MKDFKNLTLLFCLSLLGWQPIFAAHSPADCILEAVDITDYIENGITEANHGWTCSDPTNLPVIATTTTPDLNGLSIDFSIPRACNTTNDTPVDVWYKFTPTMALNAWVDLYRGAANGDMVIELYSTTTALGGDCSAITGEIAYMGCSDQGNGNFAERERAICTGLSGERIDISGLPVNETYYLRIYEWNATTSPVADIDFALCVEVSTPIGPAEDDCSDLDMNSDGSEDGLIEATTGCGNAPEGRDVDITYFRQSNAGSFGNSLAGFSEGNIFTPCTLSEYADNSIIPTSTTGTADVDTNCDGIDNTLSLVVNNVINNNVMYAVRVSPCDAGNSATVTIEFSDLVAYPTDGALQVTVVGPLPGVGDPAPTTDAGACATALPTVFTLAHDVTTSNCVSFTNSGNFIAGTFIIMVEGSNGTLLKWDLNINIDYTAACATGSCDETDAINPDNTEPDPILAVGFAGFKGFVEAKGNRLVWETETETENKLFEVERSENGRDFSKIGVVNGQGTTTTAQRYVYFDNSAPYMAYYRLKQVDFNGQYTYSNTIQIDRKAGDLTINNIYPVPVLEEAFISFSTKAIGKATISLTDVFGKVISTKEVATIAGENKEIIDLSSQAAGVYFVTIDYNDRQAVQRIMKN